MMLMCTTAERDETSTWDYGQRMAQQQATVCVSLSRAPERFWAEARKMEERLLVYGPRDGTSALLIRWVDMRRCVSQGADTRRAEASPAWQKGKCPCAALSLHSRPGQ